MPTRACGLMTSSMLSIILGQSTRIAAYRVVAHGIKRMFPWAATSGWAALAWLHALCHCGRTAGELPAVRCGTPDRLSAAISVAGTPQGSWQRAPPQREAD
eukprot:4302854-Amphidinium_carterae.1